ncbi:fatty acid oxygenase [Diplodia corticola]|uniref:Fatty acid oxygenase n=1 Tax=Diplodia corticola TaxID=236234 RepID=A0A1J9R480_9PEZI|nr:fatty acid oxygenase [Diplodia corticola]OJD36254.1 fatty acid oxygenase [Diplodia corticola]
MASGNVNRGRTAEASNLLSIATKAAEDVHSQAGRVAPNLNLVRNFGQTLLANGTVDDRKYLYEGVIQLATSLPNDSGLRDDLSAQFIKTLWNALEHPPISYLGEPFKYRAADGSNNNIMYPQLGAAGSHYARSVVGQNLRSTSLPEPGLIFDTLLRRDGLAREHPTKVSSHLFYFATIIIHDIFRTNDQDDTKLVSSSYLDLGPLYGHCQDQQNGVRTFKDGTLKKDAFAEWRLLGQPPGVCALMIAFNRFHNYVVQELATINENGRFSLPSGLDPESSEYNTALLKRDNDLFQTGRLITCGLYVNVILNDYLRTILNLNDTDVESNWRLDPREAFSNVFDSEGTPKGVGNQVSAEFNFIYRWHSATSNRDEAWLNDFMAKIYGKDMDFSTLSTSEFLTKLRQWVYTSVPRDPGEWAFGDLARGEDGSFSTADLVKLLQKGTDTVAGAFGARNVPPALKAIEILGIEQGRRWGLASLNEFRQFFKLKPFATFKEINTQPGIAETLEALYGHPNNVELYPGLMAEEAKKPFSPGSGLCPGFTISEAILSDAVTLVRGDRFYSVEYGPQSLTSFGFKEASSDSDVAGGGVMYKLLMRAFPGFYRANSTYALYPFNTPERMRELFTKHGFPHNIELNYSPPKFIGPPVPVVTWKGVVDVLHDQQRFKVPWGKHTSQLTGHDYMLSGDKPANSKQRREVEEAMNRPSDSLAEVRSFYENITRDLIRKNKRKLGNFYQIDIVKDIGNLAHAIFTAKYFDIPLRDDSSTNAKDGYTAKELYDVLAHLFQYVFLDIDTATSYKNRVVAARETRQLGDAVRKAVERASKAPGLIQMFLDFLAPSSGPALPGFGRELVSRLLENGKSVEDVVWELIPTQAAAAATQAQAWAQLIDVYMSDEYKHHWPAIVELARSDDPSAFEQLEKYALEGFRLFPAASGVLRTDSGAAPDSQQAQLFLSFTAASLDPAVFPSPHAVRLDRPAESYIHHGWGPHACLGRPIVTTAAAAMLRVLARETSCSGGAGLARAKGQRGEMRRKEGQGGAFPVFLSEDGAGWGVFPVGKVVVWGGEGEGGEGGAVQVQANGGTSVNGNGALPVGNGHVGGRMG